MYKTYKEKGPGADDTSLEKGLELIGYYKQELQEYNKKKDDKVLEEKLFNLEISSFPELVGIEDENKKLENLYNVFRDVRNTMSELSNMLWSKLDLS